ncbi:MAG: DUF6386 family protein [Pseudomonadota bacterium]
MLGSLLKTFQRPQKRDFRLVTDTSTICIFDPDCLEHRLDDRGDWWTIPEDELLELNQKNVMIVALPEDSFYDVCFAKDFDPNPDDMVQAFVQCKSGEFFVGAGEYIPGEDMTLSDWRHEYISGVIVKAEKGTHLAVLKFYHPNKIQVQVSSADDFSTNTFKQLLSLGR